LVCGKASGVDAFDLDTDIFADELYGDTEPNTLISGHRPGRCHVLFQHEADLIAEKCHFIGIEYFGNSKDGNGNNIVLPPSIHYSGEVYNLTFKDVVKNNSKQPT
ncbi:MAG: bifunctional DNA primase/polymerase, partial [Nitrospirae bacterium]|nr:bifunctional DNA primase/polymerase [Nitrospirota bacterium]